MYTTMRFPIVALMAVLMTAVGFAQDSRAACLTIRNDTNRVIVVQESVLQHGQAKRLRPIRLLPGESVKQSDSLVGTRSFEVFDGQSPTVRLWSGKLWIGDGNRTLAVINDSKGVSMREVSSAVMVGHKK